MRTCIDSDEREEAESGSACKKRGAKKRGGAFSLVNICIFVPVKQATEHQQQKLQRLRRASKASS
jgi:hypothetical protein